MNGEPSAGAVRIVRRNDELIGDQYEKFEGTENFERAAAIIDAEVKPLLEALELLAALDDVDASTADRARAALAAWRGE